MNGDSNRWGSSEEREISVTTIFWKILYGWRLILVSALAFAVLLTTAKYIKDTTAMKSTSNTISSVTEEQLSSQDQAVLTSVKTLQNQLKAKEDYMQSSILMKLDPYQKDVVALQYYVDTGYTFKMDSEVKRDNTTSLINSYIAYIDDSGLLQTVCKSLDWDIKDAYVAELIDSSNKITGTSDALAQNAVFSVFLTGADEKKANQLADAVEQAIGDYQKTLAENVGSHELKLIDRYAGKESDNNLADKQGTLENSIVTLRAQLNTMLEGLSVEQKQVLTKDGETDKTAESTPTSTLVSISKKYAVLGALGGAFLACIWILVSFILDKRIKTVQELEKYYNVRVFGKLLKESKKKRLFSGMDRWLDSLQHTDKSTLEQQRSMTLMNLKMKCKQEGIEHLFITNVVNFSNQEKQNVDVLIEGICSLGIKVNVGEDILHNAESFEKMAEIGNVILIEKIEESYHDIFEQELRLCEGQKTQVLGVIVFA